MTSFTIVTGVTGGFIAPTPTSHIIIETSLDGKFVEITKSLKDDNAQDGYMTTKSALDNDEKVKNLMQGWIKTLSQLPVEEPRGSEDIYGFDTVIQLVSSSLKWQNTPNEGCATTPSSRVPTKREKEEFKRLINELSSFCK